MAEAGVVRLSGIELKFPAVEQVRVRYDHERDTLFVGLKSPPPAVSYDLTDEAWVRLIPTTGEVVGFEIEDYERLFLVRQPRLAQLWRENQGSTSVPGRTTPPQSFAAEIFAVLKDLLTCTT